jgi:predicted 3-demethylubiquinone-9 3-methyltransferase (glyoxalase superfamily)
MKKITPCLWFDDKAEEAAKFYVSLIKSSKIGSITRYGKESAAASGRPAGSVMTVTFRLNGQKFMALNGGPAFTFSPAVSFIVNCDTQGEIDRLWEKLSRGGEKNVCGWLQDKYGVSWQIVPTILEKLMKSRDPEKTNRVMQAILKMKKLNIAGLKKAYAQR